MRQTRNTIDDLRAASRLAIEATRGVTAVVEEMHRTIGSGPAILGRPLAEPARLLLGPIYAQIRGTMGLVGAGLDVALAKLTPLVNQGLPGFEREAVVAALNGVLGDYLQESGNPLAIEMRIRHQGRPLELGSAELLADLPQAGSRLLVLVHGSSVSDMQWTRLGHEHGAALARDLGYTPVYLHYNSGLHISTNGRAFAELLEQLVSAWPVPLEELAILGHSMGGLVARSACHHGEQARYRWRKTLRTLICLGTPHHGSPWERIGNRVDRFLGISPYSAPLARLGKIRSAGVTDLRHGNVLDEHWQGIDRFAHARDFRTRLSLPSGVKCCAIAAAGDGLVPVDSALGRHENPELMLSFLEEHQWTGHGMRHLDLLSHADVYAVIRKWLT